MDEIQANRIKHKFGADVFRNTSFYVREGTLYIFQLDDSGNTGIPVMTYAPGIWYSIETAFVQKED